MPLTERGSEIRRATERLGWQVHRQKGSHVTMTGLSGGRVVVPVHGGKDLAPGTFAGIAQQAGLTAQELYNLL
jgi:predicted RNA binding protein YcfA (HicA-like mRNA interferase family)